MAAFLALLAFLQTAGVHVERVSVPGPNGVNLDAALVLPEGQTRAPPIVALHGCGGPFPSRDGQWAVLLAKAGHIVLLPDSFGSRGLGSQCAMKEREVTPAELRRQDAIDTAQWLAARPGSRCRFTMQWTSTDTTQQVIANTQIVDRLELWRAGRNEWLEHVELSKRFHEHLREHAVLPDRSWTLATQAA
jgi:predicted acyl esterase